MTDETLRVDGDLVDVKRPPEDNYDRDSKAFLYGMDRYLVEYFGERCPEVDTDCACCKMWLLRDQMREIVVYVMKEEP